jgi:uncharacterized membrane protein YphA (DoxX/SURF4 family)
MNTNIATLFTRLLLGIILFWQGFGKIFTWGFDNVYKSFEAYQDTFLPTFVLKFAAVFTTYGEFIFGLLLILGLFRKYTYMGAALLLLIVAFGHGLQVPIWDLHHVFVRSVFLIFLMMVPLEKDAYALDSFLKKK